MSNELYSDCFCKLQPRAIVFFGLGTRHETARSIMDFAQILLPAVTSNVQVVPANVAFCIN
jgi:hypothetical protein